MASGYNGSGTFNLPVTFVPNTPATAEDQNTQDQSIAAQGLSLVLVRDGQAPMTGDLDFGGHKGINLGNGVNPADAVNLSQAKTLVSGPVNYVSTPQTVDSTYDVKRYVVTSASTFTLPLASTLRNGFGIYIEAKADTTLTPNGVDSFNGYGAGVSVVVPAGAAVFFYTDAATPGNWYIDGMEWIVPFVNAISAGSYTVSASDNGKLLSFAAGTFQVVNFPSPSTLPANFRCMIVNNESTAIGKGVGGTEPGSFTLYPSQSYVVFRDGGLMKLQGGLQQYKVNSVTLFCNQTVGSDDPLVADGLADSTRARKTLNFTRQQLYQDFNHNGSQPTVICTGTFSESVTFGGQPTNCGVFFWKGVSPAAFVWRPTNSGSPFCCTIGDGATVEMQNVTFDGNSINAIAVQLHQTAILDILSGCVFGAFGSGNHFGMDGAGWTLNLDASYSVTGAAAFHVNAVGAGTINQTGGTTVSINAGLSFTAWFKGFGPIIFNLGPSITFGTLTAGTKWQMGPASVISTSSNTIPGPTAGQPAIGLAPAAGTGWAV